MPVKPPPTTINLFLGFLQPTLGQALINGLDVADHPQETKKFLAYLPETVMLYPHLMGLENLRFFSALAGFRYGDDELVQCLSLAGLQLEAHAKRVGTYFKGMRQKVGIAIALAKRAKALLLDESTSGLDPKAANEFSDTLRTLSAGGAAILMTTHDIFRSYRSLKAERETAARDARSQWLGQGDKNPHSAAHYGTYAFRPNRN